MHQAKNNYRMAAVGQLGILYRQIDHYLFEVKTLIYRFVANMIMIFFLIRLGISLYNPTRDYYMNFSPYMYLVHGFSQLC